MPDETRKIVIADDSVELCKLLQNILSQEGYEVSIVHDGFSLITHLKDRQDTDAVILDLVMPEKDGIGVFDTVRSVAPASKLIIYTGHSDYRHSVFGRQADAFLDKAEGAEQLIEVLNRMLS